MYDDEQKESVTTQELTFSESGQDVQVAKIKETEKTLDTIFNVKYKNLTKFNANQLFEESIQQIQQMGYFIKEKQREIKEHIKEKNKWKQNAKNDNASVNHPFNLALEESEAAIKDFTVVSDYRLVGAEFLYKLVQKLLVLIQESKDVELETRSMEQRKEIYESVLDKAEEREARNQKQIADLINQVITLTKIIKEIQATTKEIDEEADERFEILKDKLDKRSFNDIIPKKIKKQTKKEAEEDIEEKENDEDSSEEEQEAVEEEIIQYESKPQQYQEPLPQKVEEKRVIQEEIIVSEDDKEAIKNMRGIGKQLNYLLKRYPKLDAKQLTNILPDVGASRLMHELKMYKKLNG